MQSRSLLGAAFAVIDRTIVWATIMAVVLLMAAMVVSVIVGVFFRYALASALPWPEEFARFAMIWVTMLGASLVLRYTGHIAVLFLVEWLPELTRRVVLLAGQALVALFLILLLVNGIDMTRRVQSQTAPALRISMSVPNLALPLGAALMLYHLGVLTFARNYRGPLLPDVPPDGAP